MLKKTIFYWIKVLHFCNIMPIYSTMEFFNSILIIVFIAILMVILTGFIPVGFMFIGGLIMLIIPLIMEKMRRWWTYNLKPLKYKKFLKKPFKNHNLQVEKYPIYWATLAFVSIWFLIYSIKSTLNLTR